VICVSGPPISFHFNPALDLVITKAEGLVTFEDIQGHIDCESQRRALGYPEVIDATGARTNVTPDDVKQIVERLRVEASKGAFGATAIVTNSDHLFGMARMLGIVSELRGGPAIAVFRTHEEAMAWLSSRLPPMPAC
jgi:hypothetical protein